MTHHRHATPSAHPNKGTLHLKRGQRDVFVCLGCPNKIAQNGGLTQHTCVSRNPGVSEVLDHGAGQFSSGPLLGVQTATSCVLTWQRESEFSAVSFYEDMKQGSTLDLI